MKTNQLFQLFACCALLSSCAYHGTPGQQVRVSTKIISPRGSHDLPSVVMRNVESAKIEMGNHAGAVSGISAVYKTSEVDGDVNLAGYIGIANTTYSFSAVPADAKPHSIALDHTTRAVIKATRIDVTGTELNISQK